MLKSIIDNMNGKLNVNYTYAFWINSFGPGKIFELLHYD